MNHFGPVPRKEELVFLLVKKILCIKYIFIEKCGFTLDNMIDK